MVSQSLEESGARIDIIALAAFSGSIGYSLAHINRAKKLIIPIHICKGFQRMPVMPSSA